MGRCPRNAIDWLRALVLVTMYSSVQGHTSSTEVLKSSMHFLSTKHTRSIFNPTTYLQTSVVSLQYTPSLPEVFIRRKETTGDWYEISSPPVTSNPEFTKNPESSYTYLLLNESPPASTITSSVNSLDIHTSSRYNEQVWASSSTLILGSLTKETNINNATALVSLELRANNLQSGLYSIPKLDSVSTQLLITNSEKSSKHLEKKLASTKSLEVSSFHQNVSFLLENQDTVETLPYSTSESLQSYSNKEIIPHSLQTLSSKIDLSFSSVGKFVDDQTLYPSSVIYSVDLQSTISTPTSDAFPSTLTESPELIEWPASIQEENASSLYPSIKNSSMQYNNIKMSGNSESATHINDHTMFSTQEISTEHSLVASINPSKHSLSENLNGSPSNEIQQSFHIQTSNRSDVPLSDDHRTTLSSKVMKSNTWDQSSSIINIPKDNDDFVQFTSDFSSTIKTPYSLGGTGSITGNEITSTQSFAYKSSLSISSTHLEFYTTSFAEDSSYNTVTPSLQPSKAFILGLSDLLNSSSSTESILTTAPFHSTLDMSVVSSVAFGDSDILVTPFKVEETESKKRGGNPSWSEIYSDYGPGDVYESGSMIAVQNEQVKNSAIVTSSVHMHRFPSKSASKKQSTILFDRHVTFSSVLAPTKAEFQTSSIDTLNSSYHEKESKTTGNPLIPNTGSRSDTIYQLKTISGMRNTKAIMNHFPTDSVTKTDTIDQLKLRTQMRESNMMNAVSAEFRRSKIDQLKSSLQESKTVFNLFSTDTEFRTQTIDQLKSSTQLRETKALMDQFSIDLETSTIHQLKSSSQGTDLSSMMDPFTTDAVIQTHTYEQLGSGTNHFTTHSKINRIEKPVTSSHEDESITLMSTFSSYTEFQTNTTDHLESSREIVESKTIENRITDFQTKRNEKIKLILKERKPKSFSTGREFETNSVDELKSSTEEGEQNILENLLLTKFHVNPIQSSSEERRSNTMNSLFPTDAALLPTYTIKTSSQEGKTKTKDMTADQQSTKLHFNKEIITTPIITDMLQSVYVGTSKHMKSSDHPIHSSTTVSYYSSILQDLQTFYDSVPEEWDQWTTTMEPLHISSDNPAELLSTLAPSEEAVEAQSKQTEEEISSFFSQTLTTMSSHSASSADHELLRSFKENNLGLDTHVISDHQSKRQFTIDDLLSISSSNIVTTTKPSALIHSSFGDSIGYSSHSTIMGYMSSSFSIVLRTFDFNNYMIQMTMPTQANNDKTSSRVPSDETPFTTTVSRFDDGNRDDENRTVETPDTDSHSIMSSIYYKDAEITTQSMLTSSKLMNTSTQHVQIQNLPYAETSTAQFSIESQHVYLITSDLKTVDKKLLSSSPIYATSSTMSRVVSTISQAVIPTSQAVTTTSQAVSTTSQAVSTSSQAVRPTSQAVGTTSQAVSTTSQAVSTSSQAVRPTSQAVRPTSQAVSTSSQAVRPTSQAVSTTSQAVSTSSQAVRPTSQDVSTTSQAVSTTSQAVSTMSQRVVFIEGSAVQSQVSTDQISSSAFVADADLSVRVQEESDVFHRKSSSVYFPSSFLSNLSPSEFSFSKGPTPYETKFIGSSVIKDPLNTHEITQTSAITMQTTTMPDILHTPSSKGIFYSEMIGLTNEKPFKDNQMLSAISSEKSDLVSESVYLHQKQTTNPSDFQSSILKYSVLPSYNKGNSIITTPTISISEHIGLDSSFEESSDTTTWTSEHIRLDGSGKGSSETRTIERSSVSFEEKPSLSTSLHTDAVPSSSITVYPFPENNLLVIEIDVKLGIDISKEHFKEKLEEGLTTVYIEGMSQRKRRSSSLQSKSHTKDTGIIVKIKDIKRKFGERVEIIFLVTYSGIVVSASLAEMAFQKMSDIQMSAIIGYPVVVPVSRLTSRKESPPADDWWGGLFNPLVITLIAVPTSIVVIATAIAIVYQCRSKSIQRYPSVPSQMDSLYKHNLVVDVENGDVRNRRIFYDYPSDDEYSMASSEVFNEIKNKYSQSMHSKIRNFEKLNTKNHFYNQLERKPSDAVRNKVTFGLDGDDNKCRCTKTDSNESNDSGVIIENPTPPVQEQNNLKLDVPNAKAPHIFQAQNDSQAAPKSVHVPLQNPYPVKKKSNLVKLTGERVTSWVFMGENTNVANECIPQSCDSKQIRTASDDVTQIAHDCNYIPPQQNPQGPESDQDALHGVQDHIYETLNRQQPAKCDHSTGTQTQSETSGSDGFEYLEPLRQLLLAVEQQRRRVPPVDQFLNDETIFKHTVQGVCNLEHRTPISPSVKSPPLPVKNFKDGRKSESDKDSRVCSTDSDKRTLNETQERNERQLVKETDTKCEEVSRADSCTYDEPFLYPVGFAHSAEI